MEATMYTRDLKGRFEGGFQAYMPVGLTTDMMIKTFGPRDTDGFYEPERGYDGDEWSFFRNADNVTFRIYARYGMFRIGANDEEGVEAFGAWACEQLGLADRPKLANHWISPIGTVEAIR
jgi:hypothetical protein